jgi:hypothetical protein
MGIGKQVSVASRVRHPKEATSGGRMLRDEPPPRAMTAGLVTLGIALAPALIAIWAVPWFITQDGPAHVYNAQILATSVGGFEPGSPWRDVYAVRWQPIPNWAGPISLAGLVACMPAWLADKIMTSLTLVGFAASIFWLRWRVAGATGLRISALFASLLAMNMAWLFGFSSFMLGACLFPITLGYWWPARDRLDIARLLTLAVLLALGYFCHLVSLALTILGLSVLSLAAPVSNSGESPWRLRLARTARLSAAFIPLVGLGLCYLSVARQRGAMYPHWGNLENPWSPRAWIVRLEWVDPLSLAIRDGLPWTDKYGPEYALFAPVVWLAVALIFWWYGRITHPRRDPDFRDRRGWFLLAALLIAGGVVGPDSFGATHGEYLPQRLVLLGLVTLVPIFDFDLSRWPGRVAVPALVAAVALQSAIVSDYAFYSDRTAGQIIRARDAVGKGQKIATLLVSTKSRFRPNPLLHADNWLGVDTGNVVWNNYETAHYYFPVHFQPGIDRPEPGDLEWVSLHEGASEASDRASAWEQILSQHPDSIDVVVVWKSDPALDSITRRWFDQVERRGDVNIFRRAGAAN